MEMLPHEVDLYAHEPVRPLKRIEYERLTAEGFLEDEKVELLFGVVVEMTPIDPAHAESTNLIADLIRERVGAHARIRPVAAPDVSISVDDILPPAGV